MTKSAVRWKPKLWQRLFLEIFWRHPLNVQSVEVALMRERSTICKKTFLFVRKSKFKKARSMWLIWPFFTPFIFGMGCDVISCFSWTSNIPHESRFKVSNNMTVCTSIGLRLSGLTRQITVFHSGPSKTGGCVERVMAFYWILKTS